jgi:LysR family transcriptional regulator, positive regulator for ilvC
MTIEELHLFQHLGTTLRFTRTAAACNISPSALSRTVQRLEAELNCELFHRDKRQVKLTPAGMIFAAFTRETLDRYHETRLRLSEEDQEVRGEVSLFCSVTAAQSLLNAILPPFRKQYPGVTMHLLTGDSADAVERVLEGVADISIAARPENLAEALDFHELTRTPLVFIAPRHAGDGTEGDPVGDAASDPGTMSFILADRALSRRYTERWFRARGIRPRIYAEVAGHEAIIAMVQLGFGVGVVPKLVLDQSPLASGVRILPLEPALPEYRVGLCARRRRLRAGPVRAFWELGREITFPS